MARRTHTLYIDEDIWQRFRQIMLQEKRSASGKIEDYMKAYIAEYEGRTDVDLETSTADYEALKQHHIKLVTETENLEKRFRRIGQYESLDEFSEKVGLERSLDNFAKMVPVMLEKWQGREADIHMWITFLELVRDRRLVEARLEEARKAMVEKGNHES